MTTTSSDGWVTNDGSDERPQPRVIVELVVSGETVVRHGQFLWNGFWLLNDRTKVKDWYVEHWRPKVEPAREEKRKRCYTPTTNRPR